jgi:hypothetical protein
MLPAAASVKRLFSGGLASPVKTFPAFPGGTEAHYLHAQPGRISVAMVEQEEVEVPEGEVRFRAVQCGLERFRTVIRRSEPLWTALNCSEMSAGRQGSRARADGE